MGIEGNSLILNDAYYHLTTTIGPKYEGDYGDGSWEDMAILYNGSGNVYGIMDYNGNVFTDINYDGKIDATDVAITLKKQGYDSWASINYAVMLFGSQNYLATAY